MDKLDIAIDDTEAEAKKIAQDKLKYKEFYATPTQEYEQNKNNKELIAGIGIIIVGLITLFFAYTIAKKLLTYLQMQSHQIRLIFFISVLWIILIPVLAIFINEFDRYGFAEPHVVVLLTISAPFFIFIAYFLAKKLKLNFISSDKS